ncbi:MAG: hypothetical protein AMQ22_00097 [Candidatus Methanofastidiosum methylothiophilum]|uniref:Uncharacterized protein n=1 Tax=Candidatus Methanofastidiosum methylothiophilum TaxID=1705564 RepID=A0A150J9I5_9EURY|nr:MAG: hypothetical protein AMQ22_00097 [Candidatus Methanofastidiosum methylthiophilus]
MDEEVLEVLEDVCSWIEGYYISLNNWKLESKWRKNAEIIKKKRQEQDKSKEGDNVGRG